MSSITVSSRIDNFMQASNGAEAINELFNQGEDWSIGDGTLAYTVGVNGYYINADLLLGGGFSVDSINCLALLADGSLAFSVVTRSCFDSTETEVFNWSAPTHLQALIPLCLAPYTVGTLPTGSVGDTAYVTDALAAPVYNATATGGGTVKAKVFHNGTAWVYA